MKGDKESLMRLPLAHLQVFASALGVTYTQFELKETIVDNIQKQIRDAKNEINRLNQRMASKTRGFRQVDNYDRR